ncbi:MAG TPA: sodium/glutamate symporter [Pelomicrobium sp.]|nr:sodium/glutamate symporter [Pelomicrobium sp.]
MIDFDGAQGVLNVKPFLSVTAGIAVLFVGKALNGRIALLRNYNIPEPVTGGLLFSFAFLLLHAASGVAVNFELTARDILLVYFFTTIGINARVDELVAGGRPLAIMLAATVAFMVLQNGVGIGLATLLGQPAGVGMLAGSVSLVGGHGTTIAWAPLFEERGIAGAAEIGIAAATVGLVLASISGGPIAKFLIRRHELKGGPEALDVGVRDDRKHTPIDYLSFLHAILAIHIAGIIGILAYDALVDLGFKLPLFLTCLAAGLLITNLQPLVLPKASWPARTPALALIAEVSLGVFLAMSLMSMQLWTLADVAGTLAIILAAQLAVAVAFILLVLFPLLGRGYPAAVMSAGFAGFGLGATPAAMANMAAVTQHHGACHVAFLVVPLVGAFFIDITNSLVIRAFLGLF